MNARPGVSALGLVVLSIGGVVLLGAGTVHAGQTLNFQHRDARYLCPGQKQGGLAFIPDTVTDPKTPVPLVVFLHGLNAGATLHPWFGGGEYDLRGHLEQFARAHALAFVLAAPSNTRDAGYYRNLWQGFDTSEFVEDTARAVSGEALIDESRVFVAGHSAAGCNLRGGLLTAALPEGRVHAKGLLLIDTCLDDDVARRLADRWPETQLWVTWQDVTWKRKPEVFRDAVDQWQPLGAWFRMQRIETEAITPHQALVLPSLLRMLTRWVSRNESPQKDASVLRSTADEVVADGSSEERD